MDGTKSDLRKLAEFIHDLSWETLPQEVQEAVSFRVLDLISVATGACKDSLVTQAAEAFQAGSGEGSSSVWGWEKTYPLQTAVMLNSMLAHTLELDDVHPGSKTHGSASLIPAAWGCAEYLGKSGKEFLTAVVCGYETVSRIGMALGVSSHRNQGWHATATCGVFGCAAACAKLMDLDVEQIISALGMAGTQSSGVWAFLGDGSNCKILHPGRAAVDGLEAALLARAGMTGPEHILDAKDGGLLYAMSDGGDVSKVSEGLGEVYEILHMDMKPYPCCRSAHCAVDCALELRKRLRSENLSAGKSQDQAMGQNHDMGSIDEEIDVCAERHQLETDDISSIDIQTYLVGYKQCAVSDGCLHPRRVLDAKFSTPYAVAAALIYGKVSMDEFEPCVVESEEIQQLLEKVKVVADDRFTSQYPKHWGCAMTITLTDGTKLQTEVQDPSGSVNRPLTREQVMAKAAEFIKVGYPENGQKVIGDILNLETCEKLPQWRVK